MRELKDLSQEVIIASATLDGRVAVQTSSALGDRLRFLNSYHSNLIEGHKSSIVEIEMALNQDFSEDDQKRYLKNMLNSAGCMTLPGFMGMDSQSARHARLIVSQLVNEGLVCSESHRAPLTIGFPIHVLKYYFPDLFDPSVMGDEERILNIGTHRKTARTPTR